MKPKQSKELHCEIDTFDKNQTGNDAQWTFKNKKIDEDSMAKLGLHIFNKKFTSILIIEEAQPRNEGLYNCVVADRAKSVDIVVMPGTEDLNNYYSY